jgi:hypothetical protein
MIEGFAAASARWVRAVKGGVVRATRGSEPTVAVVVGGGSGHYPAFGGLVDPGLAHGAAMGNLFASPSAHQVHAVATAADEGRGAAELRQLRRRRAALQSRGYRLRRGPRPGAVSFALVTHTVLDVLAALDALR